MELEQKLSASPQEFITTTPKVLGPFATLCRYSGLDLTQCGIRKRTAWPLSAIRIAIAAIIIISFIIKLVTAAMNKDAPLTVKWGESISNTGIYGFSVCAAVSLLIWTRSGFIQSFEDQLGRLKSLRVQRDDTVDNYRKEFIKMAAFGIVIMLSFSLTSVKHILYDVITPEESLFNNYTFNQTTMFGFEPVVTFYMGVINFVVLTIYCLVHVNLLREITYFNEELQKSSRAQQLSIPDVFIAYGKRHLNITLLVKHTNMHLGKLANFGPFLLCFTAASTVFIFSSFMDDISIGFGIEITALNILSMIILVQLLGAPGKIQEAINRTMCILLDDDTVPTATDQRIIHSFRMFSERCAKCTPMRTVAIKIDEHLIHKVLIFVPNIGTMLTFLRKLIQN